MARCGEALALARDARLLCDRADALLGLDMFDDGEPAPPPAARRPADARR